MERLKSPKKGQKVTLKTGQMCAISNKPSIVLTILREKSAKVVQSIKIEPNWRSFQSPGPLTVVQSITGKSEPD